MPWRSARDLDRRSAPRPAGHGCSSSAVASVACSPRSSSDAPTSTSRWWSARTITSSSRCSTRSPPASVPGAVAPPLREVLKRHDNVKRVLGEVTGFDLAARTVHVEHPNSSSDLGIRLPDLRHRGRQLVLRPPRVRTARTDHEDRRRRAGPAHPDLRRVRDGRARRGRRRTSRLAHVRRRRRRADGRGGRRTDRRTRAPFPGAQLPSLRPEQRHGDALRGRRGDPADLRRPPVRGRRPAS